MNDGQKQSLAREYQALWRDFGALSDEDARKPWSLVTEPPETLPVPLSGNPQADLVFVGEQTLAGPGADLLGKIVEAMGYALQSVGYTGETDPHRLRKQLANVPARVVVTLGETATQALIDVPFEKAVGQFHTLLDLPRVKVLPTLEPSALLKNPALKKTVWEAMKRVMAMLETR